MPANGVYVNDMTCHRLLLTIDDSHQYLRYVVNGMAALAWRSNANQLTRSGNASNDQLTSMILNIVAAARHRRHVVMIIKPLTGVVVMTNHANNDA